MKPTAISSVSDGFKYVSKSFKSLCSTVNSPRALTAWMLFRSREWEQLFSLSVDPLHYNSAYAFSQDLLCSEYLSKIQGLGKIDTKAAALHSFRKSEEDCRLTNIRLKSEVGSPRVEHVISNVKRKISRILGPVPSFDSGCMWGPGVTTTLKGSDATLQNKLLEFPLHCSRYAMKYLVRQINDDHHWLQALNIGYVTAGDIVSEDACVVTTVPKNSKTDRTIAIEPTGNIFLQKSLGSYIRKRLMISGCDLNDQTHNQKAAMNASLALFQEPVATVDLKAASDTISKELIYLLLPIDWAYVLDDLRSKNYCLEGKISPFHKFSSMGNGFTFELESLLFYSISLAVTEIEGLDKNLVSVYGDDLILPVRAMDLLIETFSFLGFALNMKKSHFASPYRESCGEHFFNGYCVTPIYQKSIPRTTLEYITFQNRIFDYCCFNGTVVHMEWWYKSTRLPGKYYIPWYFEGDSGVRVPFGTRIPHCRPVPGGLLLLVLQSQSITTEINGRAGLSLWLRLSSTRVDEPKIVSDGEPLVVDPTAQRKRLRYFQRWKYFSGTNR